MGINLEVKIGNLKLNNPVIAASGTFGDEYKELIDIKSLGAIVAKTITLNPRIGNPPPRVAETASGMLNSIGLENKGIDYFIKEKLPELKKLKTPIIASIAGDNKGDYVKLAKTLSNVNIKAIELNLSCPNIKHGNRPDLIAQDEGAIFDVVKAVRKVTDITLIAKLSPNVTSILKMARMAEEAGADAVVIANTMFGMAVDIDTGMPKLGNIIGGLSGPAVKPILLKMVWDAYKRIDIPIIASGGIMDYKDAVEFILCGASAVQIGTVNFVNPNATHEIIDGIKSYLKKNEIDDIRKLIGRVKQGKG